MTVCDLLMDREPMETTGDWRRTMDRKASQWSMARACWWLSLFPPYAPLLLRKPVGTACLSVSGPIRLVAGERPLVGLWLRQTGRRRHLCWGVRWMGISRLPSLAPAGRHLFVFFDGKCPVCVREIGWLSRRTTSRGRSVAYVDVSQPAVHVDEETGRFLSQHIDIHDEDEKRALLLYMTAIRSDGVRLQGIDVFATLYREAGLERLAAVLESKPLRPLLESLYRWWAHNRFWILQRKDCTVCQAQGNSTLHKRP